MPDLDTCRHGNHVCQECGRIKLDKLKSANARAAYWQGRADAAERIVNGMRAVLSETTRPEIIDASCTDTEEK